MVQEDLDLLQEIYGHLRQAPVQVINKEDDSITIKGEHVEDLAEATLQLTLRLFNLELFRQAGLSLVRLICLLLRLRRTNFFCYAEGRFQEVSQTREEAGGFRRQRSLKSHIDYSQSL